MTPPAANLVFQSERHPLVLEDPRSSEQLIRSLIHLKAYDFARRDAVDRKVLDVGCNTGYGTRIIAEAAREIFGVDVAARAIEIARDSARDLSKEIRFGVADGDVLNFPDAEFDRVVSFQVIEHVEEVGRYLEEIARVLEPGGHAIFTTPNATLRLDPGQRPWNVFHVREYTAEALVQELRRHFDHVQILGLFGEDALQAAEIRRVERSRKMGRISSLLALKRFLLTRASDEFLWRLEGFMERLFERRLDGGRAELPSWDLDSLEYREDDLDRALDFTAICTKRAEG
jgi:SAM-dependent methyltransferase